MPSNDHFNLETDIHAYSWTVKFEDISSLTSSLYYLRYTHPTYKWVTANKLRNNSRQTCC